MLPYFIKHLFANKITLGMYRHIKEFTDSLSQASDDDAEMYYPHEHVLSSRAGHPWYQEALNHLQYGSFKKLECSTTQAQILTRVLDEPFAPKSQILLPSTVYGAPHLARLFMKLPDVLDYSEASLQKLRITSKHLRMLLRYLESNVDWFDNAYYQGGELQSELHFTN